MPRIGAVPLLAAAVALVAATPASAALDARGSVGQAYVTGAERGETLALLNARGRVVDGGRADRLGSLILRDVTPRSGYRIRRQRGALSRPFRVLKRDENPPQRFYRGIRLKAGLNYIRMRDGVELAMTVRLPAGKTLADGPFPTLIEHSGYANAAPGPGLSSGPLAPAGGTVVGTVISPLLGFAVVSVQMRGSGCSGGAFDLFDLPTTYDGYDMVEAVAAQRWVKGRRVGLAGISFSGISQLFAAGTRPPHLAALAPMSVIDDVYAATGFPGGIRNSGFAASWIAERMADARPAPGGGQAWARELIKRGDKRCRANQALRLQTENAIEIQRRNPHRTPTLFAQRAPAQWMARIDVPTFFVGQFQDEQTGGHFAASLDTLSRNPKVWITLQNGVHVDALGPDIVTRWVEFLKIYVAGEVPVVPDSVLGLSSQLYRVLADSDAKQVVQSRFAGMRSVAEARAAFERDPRVRLLMDGGAGSTGPGTLGSTWELGFSSWPIREAVATPWFLGDSGALVPSAPAAGSVSYVADPRARPAKTLPGDGAADAFKAQPPYNWAPVAAGKGVGWATAALPSDVVIAGPSSLDLSLRSTARDTDLQVTLSEVRPDGAETYVQNGWLRASHRKLASSSTALQPSPTHLAADASPLPSGAPSVVRVPIFAVAHAFRAGSRIRVTVQAVGGDRPRWEFDSIDAGRTTNTIELGPSKLVVPVVGGAVAGAPLPGPTALRGQPSRAYAPASNGG